jgi:HPt (histidine-containing phosphotransfer) domain-containing protein
MNVIGYSINKELSQVPGTGSQSPPTNCLDREALLKEVEGDSELLQELIALFLSDGRKHLREIEEAASASNAEEARLAAHALKGSAGVFGQTPFHRLAHQLELSAREGDLTAVRHLSKDLELAFQHLSRSLSCVLGELTGT